MRLIPAVLATFFLCLALGACSVYKLSMRQGNILSQDAVSKLHQGMTREQVKATMGTPLVDNPFNDHRWDYVFYFQAPGKNPEQRTISVLFQNGRVASIEQTGDPNAGANIRDNEKFIRDAEPDALPQTPQREAPRTPQT